MYFHKYSKYKPSNSSICENYINLLEFLENGKCISKCPDIRRKRRPISLHRVPPGRSDKGKKNWVGQKNVDSVQLVRLLK